MRAISTAILLFISLRVIAQDSASMFKPVKLMNKEFVTISDGGPYDEVKEFVLKQVKVGDYLRFVLKFDKNDKLKTYDYYLRTFNDSLYYLQRADPTDTSSPAVILGLEQHGEMVGRLVPSNWISDNKLESYSVAECNMRFLSLNCCTNHSGKHCCSSLSDMKEYSKKKGCIW